MTRHVTDISGNQIARQRTRYHASSFGQVEQEKGWMSDHVSHLSSEEQSLSFVFDVWRASRLIVLRGYVSLYIRGSCLSLWYRSSMDSLSLSTHMIVQFSGSTSSSSSPSVPPPCCALTCCASIANIPLVIKPPCLAPLRRSISFLLTI